MRGMMAALFALAGTYRCVAQDSKEVYRDNCVEVKFMVRGYCHAGSRIKDPEALGGFAKSDNYPKSIERDVKVEKGKLQLIVQPEEIRKLGKQKGMRLLLVNKTKATQILDACDSRLSILQEAKDEDGTWKPIEYLPSSWCGNSYHRVFLPAGKYWEFAALRYKGPFKTKLRIRLILDKENGLFSEEFEGSIHKEQFSVKQGHQPTSVMDPYND